MALHAFANDFFCLLGSSKSVQELHALLCTEWEKRWAAPLSDKVCFAAMERSSLPLTSCFPQLTALPPSYEESLPLETSAFRRVAGRVDFEGVQNRQIVSTQF